MISLSYYLSLIYILLPRLELESTSDIQLNIWGQCTLCGPTVPLS